MRAICWGISFAFAFAVFAPRPPASTPDHTTTLIHQGHR